MIAEVRARVVELLWRWPLAVSVTFLFCVFMTFGYLPYDVFGKLLIGGVAEAEEVWLGYRLEGAAAKWTEPLHWIIYAALTYGFYAERAWVWPLAGLYALQVAIATLVWSWLYGSYGPIGWLLVVAVAAGFALLGWLVWRARPAP